MSDKDLWRGLGIIGNVMLLAGILVFVCLCFAIAIM